MNTFTRGLRVFWRTDLGPAIWKVTQTVLLFSALGVLALAADGLTEGFWLFGNPVPWHQWVEARIIRGCGIVSLLIIVYGICRHILRLGNKEFT